MVKRVVLFTVAVIGAWAQGEQTRQAESQAVHQSEILIQKRVSPPAGVAVTAGIATSPLALLDAANVKGAPFSAEAVTESVQTLADGNRIVQRATARIYRDSEGRTRREQSPGGEAFGVGGSPIPVLIYLNDPVKQEAYALNPSEKTAHKIRLFRVVSEDGSAEVRGAAMSISASGAQVQRVETFEKRVGDPSGAGVAFEVEGPSSSTASFMVNSKGDVTREDLGVQIIEGVPARGQRTTLSIPAGRIGNEREITVRHEVWRSEELQMVVLSKTSDPRTGEIIYRLMNISRSEPPSYLFEVPADYKIVDPPPAPPLPSWVGAMEKK